jgi:hypothetical protein
MITYIKRSMYDWDGRKYIELEDLGKVKIPYRYGRVMAKILGHKTIQEMETGLKVEVVIENKTWDCVLYKVLYSIKEIE